MLYHAGYNLYATLSNYFEVRELYLEYALVILVSLILSVAAIIILCAYKKAIVVEERNPKIIKKRKPSDAVLI
jgi:hypothetical protein